MQFIVTDSVQTLASLINPIQASLLVAFQAWLEIDSIEKRLCSVPFPDKFQG